jgi:hypothetical protein
MRTGERIARRARERRRRQAGVDSAESECLEGGHRERRKEAGSGSAIPGLLLPGLCDIADVTHVVHHFLNLVERVCVRISGINLFCLTT